MTPFNLWLAGFLRVALALPPAEWETEAERFVAFLAVDGRVVPCTIRTTLLGALLADDDRIELGDGVLRPARLDDFSHVDTQRPLPHAVVFEYSTEVPAEISCGPVDFTDDVTERTVKAHEEALTLVMLAFAFATSGPLQLDLTMREVPYLGSSSGRPEGEAGPIVVKYPTLLDRASTDRLRLEHDKLLKSPVNHVGVAVRRYLMARSERVRPSDQVIDYAIALESMTKERGGPNQGEELARLLGDSPDERKRIEASHKAFRRARERIVHEGDTPANAKEAATLGEDLVYRSLRARTGPHTTMLGQIAAL